MTIFEAARLAHLEWIWKGSVFTVESIDFKREVVHFVQNDDVYDTYALKVFELGSVIKPIMKSLDMLTSEQIRELFMIHTGKGETEFNSSIFRLFERNCRSVLYPFGFEAFNYLIQQGFDIFGYLDADIATIQDI